MKTGRYWTSFTYDSIVFPVSLIDLEEFKSQSAVTDQYFDYKIWLCYRIVDTVIT